MNEYWESKFHEINTLWGFEPADSAIQTSDFFAKNGIKNILIPGVGYGRNAKIFISKGISVTGIEISETAIKLAKESNQLDILIHHGSVTQMHFDTNEFEGIFCYALIHLLNRSERRQFIKNCFDQLQADGFMIFVVVSEKSNMNGNGKFLSKNRYELSKGLKVYFYNIETAIKEFNDFGLIEVKEFDEPIKHMENQPDLNCLMITCQKIK